MTLTEYRSFVGQIPFGKCLPNAVYVLREVGSDYGAELNQLVSMLAARYALGDEFNVVKFRTEELKVSFLSYPDFMENSHPALRQAVTIDLISGKARHANYADNLNPPILHRKERFLPVNHPRQGQFAALTQAEEVAGLYEHTATIGFKLNWDRLLAEKGLFIVGHTLEQREVENQPTFNPSSTNRL